jgi:Sigma-70 factor, region 1.1
MTWHGLSTVRERLMPSNIKAPPEGALETWDMPFPLLDLSDDAVKEPIRGTKNRGNVSVDQINSILSPKEADAEPIKNIPSIFGEIGVNVIQANEAELEEEIVTGEEPEEEAEGELVEVRQRPFPAKFGATNALGTVFSSVPADRSALAWDPILQLGIIRPAKSRMKIFILFAAILGGMLVILHRELGSLSSPEVDDRSHSNSD